MNLSKTRNPPSEAITRLNTMIARIVTSKRLVMTKSANMTCLDDSGHGNPDETELAKGWILHKIKFINY